MITKQNIENINPRYFCLKTLAIFLGVDDKDIDVRALADNEETDRIIEIQNSEMDIAESGLIEQEMKDRDILSLLIK